MVDFAVDASPIGRGNGLSVAVAGELDIASRELLEPVVDEAVSARRPLVLDLSRCSFIDSLGLALVLKAYEGLAEGGPAGVPMAVVAGASVQRIFAVAGIGRHMPLFERREQAVEWLDRQTSTTDEPDAL